MSIPRGTTLARSPPAAARNKRLLEEDDMELTPGASGSKRPNLQEREESYGVDPDPIFSLLESLGVVVYSVARGKKTPTEKQSTDMIERFEATKKAFWSLVQDKCRAEGRYEELRAQRARVAEGGEGVADLRKDIEERFASLGGVLAGIKDGVTPAAKAQEAETYVQVARRTTGRRKTVLVYPAEGRNLTSEETRDRLRGTMDPVQLGIQVSKMARIQKGGVAVELESAESAEKFKGRMAEDLVAKEPKRRLPKLLLYDVPRELKEDELMDVVHKQNIGEKMSREDFGKKIRICFKTGPKEGDVVNYVLEAEGELRKELLSRGRVYVGWKSCKIQDYVMVLRCFKCQGFGHMAKDCKAEHSLCGHCSGNHDFGRCPKKSQAPKCINCARTGRDSAHPANDKRCNSWIAEKQRITRTIDYE